MTGTPAAIVGPDWSPGLAIMQKQSPPIAVICGSTTLSTAAAVTAASAALPPSRRASTAAKLANGCEVARFRRRR